jgi:hypothetical protein
MSMKFSAPTALSLALGLAVAVRGACWEELVIPQEWPGLSLWRSNLVCPTAVFPSLIEEEP